MFDRRTCCAVGCTMRSGTNLLSQVRLFCFPKDPKRKLLWELAVHRKNWNATLNSRLCNFHFVTGAPSKDENHPDYVPTLFKHRRMSTNAEQKLLRYERCVKRKRVKNESLISNNGAPTSGESHPDHEPTLFNDCRLSTNDVEQKLSRYEHSVERRHVENESLIVNNDFSLDEIPSASTVQVPQSLENPASESVLQPMENPTPKTVVIKNVSSIDTIRDSQMNDLEAKNPFLEGGSDLYRNYLKNERIFKSGTSITCCAIGCSMRSGTNLLSQVQLFCFPKDPKRKRLWELAVHRKNWNATKRSRLCNFHFVTGAPSSDENHPDYVPTLFKHRRMSTNVEQKLSRYERCVKRRQVENETFKTNSARKSLRPRLRPFAIPSLNLPVADNPKKCWTATKRHACSKISNRSATHSPKTLPKNSRLTETFNLHKFDPIKASEKDLKCTTVELWHKNEETKKNIECLQNEGFKEDDYKWYIDNLEEHQYIKELANHIMEKLADIENTTVKKVQEELGMR